MNAKTNSKKSRIEAVIIALIFLGTVLVPLSSLAMNTGVKETSEQNDNFYTPESDGAYILDKSYILREENPASTNTADNDDGGYKKDAGDEISKSLALYPGEVIDDTNGRGRAGKLASNDLEDWYFFCVCEGQQIALTMTPPGSYDFNLALFNKDSAEIASSNNPGSAQEVIMYTAPYAGKYYMKVSFVSGAAEGRYTFTNDLIGQDDANTGNDAGDDYTSALLLAPGQYFGYLDMNDAYDWYKFQVTSGQGINITLKMRDVAYLTDFDLQLYNPSGILIYEGNEYYDDNLEYPADATGEWRIRVDIYPGWVDCPHPVDWNYYMYGSGPYNMTIAVGPSVPAPPAPIPQPDITPIAKTFNIANDPDSTKDDFGYLASIPACNYLMGGQRYLAPIIYTGDDTPTAYFDDDVGYGTVDDTTQYLVDDWNSYLTSHGKTAAQYNVPADPIAAAAEIATQNWASSSLAVIAVDGSAYNDTVKTAVQKTVTLTRTVEVEEIPGDSEKIVDIGGAAGYPMFLTPKWCAINVSMYGLGGATPTLGTIIPHYITKDQDWWPCPYDGEGNKWDIYQPITRMGIWVAGTDRVAATWNFVITKYAGDRYRVRVTDADSVISAKITTTDPSDLLVFLVDPKGYLRSPDPPYWNGPVNPIHIWNGLENPAVNPWRNWNPGLRSEATAEVLHPEAGMWTVIVVPRNAEGPDYEYTITAEVRSIDSTRADATISAANAAVIASLNHAPLLYVTEDSIPAATASAFTTLGVNNVIFVERGEIGSGVRDSLPTITKDLTTMQQIVDEIKSYDAHENYITITSLKTGDGYFAPAAMLAAYHGSPVLRIEEAEGNPAAMADRIETWQLWDGDYYHGSLSTGHLPMASAEVEQNMLKVYISLIKFFLSGSGDVPPYGLDAKRYWNEEMVQEIQKFVSDLGLDVEDEQEAFCFVAPRDDIYIVAHSALMGNKSYAGQIPGDTAYANDIIVRDVLYPALIFSNPGKDITTSQMMNFPDGGSWKCNDGNTYKAYSSRVVKNAFSSHFRTYEGHCLWDAHLQRMNDGASVMYYSGHGTGGSGTSAQYEQTEHCNYPDQIWWDAWRGYSYDNWKTSRDNGMIWYNPEPPMLYDIVHYKWNDQLFGNLHSNMILYMSCTTGDADGPMIYLDHGAAGWYGNAGTGLCPEADLADDMFFQDIMIYGENLGAFSKQVWLHYRDFTTSDPTSMYGSSSMQVTTIQVIYGDPNLIIYSPEWISPVPVDAE